jgi:hypothetical protein
LYFIGELLLLITFLCPGMASEYGFVAKEMLNFTDQFYERIESPPKPSM